MDDRFSETVDWKSVALAPVVWAAHFSILWGASSIFPGTAAARWIALVATLLAAFALAWLWSAGRHKRSYAIPRASIALAAVAIIFGALPALIG